MSNHTLPLGRSDSAWRPVDNRDRDEMLAIRDQEVLMLRSEVKRLQAESSHAILVVVSLNLEISSLKDQLAEVDRRA